MSQALQRRGLPRAIMTDNGTAMKAGEFTKGLARLGILHKTTLAYSPYQNGKQETSGLALREDSWRCCRGRSA